LYREEGIGNLQGEAVIVRAHIPPESVSATVALAGPDWELRTTMSVPKEPMRLGELLPLVGYR